MLTRNIPATGEALPVIGVGTYRGFDVPSTGKQHAAVADVLQTLFSMGGSVVDSSPMYGRAEGIAGELLAGQHARTEGLYRHKGMDGGSRRRHRSDEPVDEVVALPSELISCKIHNLVDWRTHLATLRAWKEEGRIRYFGITHYTSSAYGQMEKIMRSETLDFVQLNYSLDDREAEQRLLPLAAERRVAVLVNLPFGQGRLFRTLRGNPVPPWLVDAGCETWSEALLKFVIAHPAVTCVIPGTGNPDHMAEELPSRNRRDARGIAAQETDRVLGFPLGQRLQGTAEQAAEKVKRCHSERSEESLLNLFSLILKSKRDCSRRSE